jgi:lysophospholipase L1-like esterase
MKLRNGISIAAMSLTCAAATVSFATDFGRIMALGDSLTGGHGTESPNGYRRQLNDIFLANADNKDFVGPLNGSVFDGGEPDNQHAGFGGWGINEILTGNSDGGTNFGLGKLSDWVSTYQPDTYLFILGGNDSWQWEPFLNGGNWYGNTAAQSSAVAWYRSQYQQVLDTVYTQNADARFLWGSYPKNEKLDPKYRDYQNSLYALLAPLAQDMVAEQRALGRDVQYVPLFENSSEVFGTYTWDGVHFNAPGGQHVANQFYTALTNPVPEPASIVVLIGVGCLLRRRRA